MFAVRYFLAGFTIPSSTKADAGERMSLRAIGFSSVGVSYSTLNIDRVSHWLNVARIATASRFAKVVAFQSFWDWTIEKFVNESVDSWSPASIQKKTVAFSIKAARPEPASRIWLDNDFCSHPFWKGAKFNGQHYAPTVAHAAVGVFV